MEQVRECIHDFIAEIGEAETLIEAVVWWGSELPNKAKNSQEVCGMFLLFAVLLDTKSRDLELEMPCLIDYRQSIANLILQVDVLDLARHPQGTHFLQRALWFINSSELFAIESLIASNVGMLAVDVHGSTLVRELVKKRPQIVRQCFQSLLKARQYSNHHGPRSYLKSCFAELCLDMHGKSAVQQMIEVADPESLQLLYPAILPDVFSIGHDRHGCCALRAIMVQMQSFVQMETPRIRAIAQRIVNESSHQIVRSQMHKVLEKAAPTMAANDDVGDVGEMLRHARSGRQPPKRVERSQDKAGMAQPQEEDERQNTWQ
jgi:hypothetical protein